MVGSEVFSSEVKKTEVLMENFRRAIGKFFGALLADCGLDGKVHEGMYGILEWKAVRSL